MRLATLLILGVLCAPALAQEAPPALRERTITFQEMGGSTAEQLRGVEGLYTWPLGLRLDETVARARLVLRYTASPALLPELSHLRVRFNGEIVGVVPVPAARDGAEAEHALEIDPRYFSDYNQLTVQLIGHYTTGCEDPQSSALWASISGKSALELSLRPLVAQGDLASLPAPFFDEHDQRRLELPFVFGPRPSQPVLAAAGVVASWFGVLADYRSARFPVWPGKLPARHSVVFATNTDRPEGVTLPQVDKPTLAIIDHPGDPALKLLLVLGRDEAQLRIAAEALALGSSALSGPRATVTELKHEPAQPGQAPRWLTTDRPVRLGELVSNPSDLEAVGHAPAPLRIRLRVAPDLFMWNSLGVPMTLAYRYSPPLERDNSMLTVTLNDRTVESFRLLPAKDDGSGRDDLVTRRLRLQPYQVAPDSELQVQFALDYHRSGPCRDSGMDLVRASLDPEESTIDFSGFAHYATLPDLSLFANAGFPFTRLADLGETAIVLPAAPTLHDIETAFFLLGRMGRETGTPALRFEWARADQIEKVKDRDLLVIGSGGLLARWGKSLPALVEGQRRALPLGQRARDMVARWTDEKPAGPAGDVAFEAGGQLAAWVAFESPEKSGRSVVALLSTSPEANAAVLDAIENSSRVRQMRGDTVFVRGEAIESFRGDERYYVGSLGLRQWLAFHLSQHLGLVIAAGIIAAALLGLVLFAFYRRVAARRLGQGH